MPHRSSGKKHVRADARKAERNRRVKSSMRTSIKIARTAITSDAADAENRLRAAISQLDKAAKKGVIKKAVANRGKSRLTCLLNAQTTEDGKA